MERWRHAADVEVVEVSRKQLETHPGEVIRRLSEVVGVSSVVGPSLAHIGEEIQPMPQIPLWPETQATLQRVARQIQLAPELESRAVAMGYLPAVDIVDESELQPAVPVGTVIAFHTPDEVYRAEAQRLRSTLDRLGLAHRFFEVQPEKNWVRTTLLKPIWMSEARETLVGPLLYIDVDAFVHQDPWPYLSQYSGDLAAVYNDGILNSATIWINDTPGARQLLKRWVEHSNIRRGDDTGQLQQTGEDSDQTVLRNIVDAAEANGDREVIFERLPSNMAHIFDQQTNGWVVGPVIIEQLQASRESTRHAKRLERRRRRLRELDAQRNDEQASPTGPRTWV